MFHLQVSSWQTLLGSFRDIQFKSCWAHPTLPCRCVTQSGKAYINHVDYVDWGFGRGVQVVQILEKIWLWFDPGFWSVMCPSIQIAQLNKPGYIYHSNLRGLSYLVPWFIMRDHVPTLRWPSNSSYLPWSSKSWKKLDHQAFTRISPQSFDSSVSEIGEAGECDFFWNRPFSVPDTQGIWYQFPSAEQMTSLSISAHFDLVTIPRFGCLCQCMSLIPLPFLNVSIFRKLLSLGCLHRCQWKNPNQHRKIC